MELFDKYGWQVATFVSVVGLMGYMVRTMLGYFREILSKANDTISNHIVKNTEVMQKVIDCQREISERIREEHRELLDMMRRCNGVKSD